MFGEVGPVFVGEMLSQRDEGRSDAMGPRAHGARNAGCCFTSIIGVRTDELTTLRQDGLVAAYGESPGDVARSHHRGVPGYRHDDRPACRTQAIAHLLAVAATLDERIVAVLHRNAMCRRLPAARDRARRRWTSFLPSGWSPHRPAHWERSRQTGAPAASGDAIQPHRATSSRRTLAPHRSRAEGGGNASCVPVVERLRAASSETSHRDGERLAPCGRGRPANDALPCRGVVPRGACCLWQPIP